MFASVGADGSVRMFDLRHPEHSTIIYEDPQHHPLLRLAWNKQDPNYLATMAMEALEVLESQQFALISLLEPQLSSFLFTSSLAKPFSHPPTSSRNNVC